MVVPAVVVVSVVSVVAAAVAVTALKPDWVHLHTALHRQSIHVAFFYTMSVLAEMNTIHDDLKHKGIYSAQNREEILKTTNDHCELKQMNTIRNIRRHHGFRPSTRMTEVWRI